MGLASSVPASTPANTGIYQYAKPDNPYTDKKYVDDNFLTSGNFNSYLTTDYRPFKTDVVNKIQNQEANFNSNFDTRLNDQFPTRFDTRLINALTGAAYINDFNQQFTGRFDTRLPTFGYNKLDNWKVAQETFTKPASSLLNTQSQSLSRLCYLNRPVGSTTEQKELCVDQNGGLYLVGLGLETNKDVYTFIAEQNNTYWTNRNTIGNASYLTPPAVTYTPTPIPSTSALSSFTTPFPTITNIVGKGTSTIKDESTLYGTVRVEIWPSSTYTATWTGTVNFSNYQPSLSNGFTSPPTTIQILGINLPGGTVTTTITSKTATSFTYRIVANGLVGSSTRLEYPTASNTNSIPDNVVGTLSLTYTATA
jgi:hypothetical protein